VEEETTKTTMTMIRSRRPMTGSTKRTTLGMTTTRKRKRKKSSRMKSMEMAMIDTMETVRSRRCCLKWIVGEQGSHRRGRSCLSRT
jgi:hypothetical protein